MEKAEATIPAANPNDPNTPATTESASYTWLADGTKASVVDQNGEGYVYLGSLIYKRLPDGTLELESTNHGSGRIVVKKDANGETVRDANGNETVRDANGNPVYEPQYHIIDHLGSVRVVVNQAGEVLARNDYYPFGKSHNNPALTAGLTNPATPEANRYLYNGKEKQLTGNLGLLDYGARMHDPELGRWFGIDPLAEQMRRMSPYAHAFNNPMRFIDPDGRFAGDFINRLGQIIGNDGKKDGKLYVIKTTEKSFGSDRNKVDAAGLSKAEVKATENFIKTNSGNTAAFEANSIAYDNSIEIEGSASVRQGMMDVVSADDGSGGTSDANNREYGGVIVNGRILAAKPGPVGTPLTGLSIGLSDAGTSFHDHGSGTITITESNGIRTDTRTVGYAQHPSQLDINNAGEHTNYVIAQGRKSEGGQKVYIYTSAGVQATIPIEKFVTPEQPK